MLFDFKASSDFKHIKYQELEFDEKIHSGFVFDVYKGKYNKIDVVIKKLNLGNKATSQEKISEFKREFSNTILLPYHPNIVYLYGYCVHENQYFLINEFCEGKDLFEILYTK